MIGESTALKHLKKDGYAILHRNYRNLYGEIDIIARKGRYLIFTEVKTRTDLKYGSPLESIDQSKVSRIRRAADFYMTNSKDPGLDIRFDVIAVFINKSHIKKISGKDDIPCERLKSSDPDSLNFIKVEHIKNAF